MVVGFVLVFGAWSRAYASEAQEAMLKRVLAESLQGQKKTKEKTKRSAILSQTAKTYGFQRAFQWQYQQLMAEVEEHAMEFAKIFDFRSVLVEGHVLPPIIRRAGPATEIVNETTAIHVEAEYVIVSQAKMVALAPSYRTYLTAETEVMSPALQLLPKNKAEEEVWQKALTEGWQEGCAHAFQAFELAFAALVADYRGILLFLRLKQEGLIKGPIVAQGELGVQVGNEVLTQDRTIFRITVPATFQGPKP